MSDTQRKCTTLYARGSGKKCHQQKLGHNSLQGGSPSSTVSLRPPVGATIGKVPSRMASICTKPHGSHLQRD